MEIQSGKVGDRKCARRLHLWCNFPRIEERRTVDGGLGLKPPKDLHTFMVKIDRYINQEETLRALLGNSQQQQQPSTEKPKKKKNPEPTQEAGPEEYKKAKKNFKDYKWTPLNASLTEVLMELKNDPNYQRPRPIPGDPPPCLAHKYCAFHDSYGHLIEQCVSLRQLIEKFI
jgi:hypothetical protein